MEEMVATLSSEAGESEVTSIIPIEEQMVVIEKEMMADGKPGTKHRGKFYCNLYWFISQVLTS